MSKKNPVIGGVASIRALKAKVAQQNAENRAAREGVPGDRVQLGPVVPVTTNGRAQSTCVDPVATVWTLAFDNFDAPRKDVIAMAIAAGVTPGTAKAQYQYWLNAIRGEENFRRVKAKPEIPRCKHGWPLAEYAGCADCATEQHDADMAAARKMLDAVNGKPARVRKPRHSSDSGPAVLAEAFASLKGNARKNPKA